MELEDIEQGLEYIRDSQERSPDDLLVLQKRLDNVDSERKNNAFLLNGKGQVAPGQGYLHDMLFHCYALVEELQAGPGTDVDASLEWIKRDLETAIANMQNLKKKGGFSASELQTYRALLLDVESKRNSLGALTMNASSVAAPKGQAYLHQLLHRAYRLLHQLESATEVAPDAVFIANQLDEIKGRLLGWRRQKDYTLAELREVQELLRQIDASRQNAAFKVNKGVPAGQAYMHNLMASCYDIVHQLTLKSAE